MIRKAILIALVLSTAACGAYRMPGESTTPSPSVGTVSGRVIAVPCAPIEPAGSVCAGRPVPGLEIDYAGGGGLVRRTATDSSGNYAIELPAGVYAVTLKTYMRVTSGALKIDVASGSAVTVNYVLDSGIRTPVPQA